jgi:hypothetical protein
LAHFCAYSLKEKRESAPSEYPISDLHYIQTYRKWCI